MYSPIFITRSRIASRHDLVRGRHIKLIHSIRSTPDSMHENPTFYAGSSPSCLCQFINTRFHVISIGGYIISWFTVTHCTHIAPLHPAITPQPTATIDELVTHVGIDKDLLNQPCSTEHLAKIAPFVPNWQKYAIAVGLNQSQIVSIKSDHILDPEMKAQQVLSLWKQANGFRATYSVLVDMCLQKKDVQLAESICNIFKG